jgi:hypothetical protein
MKLSNFYRAWGTARAFVLTAVILVFLALTIRSYCWNLEMEYSGPGSEYERSMEQYRDNENREATERLGTEQERSGDKEKSEQYGRDHGA